MAEQTPYAQWVGLTFGDYQLEQVLGFSALGPLFAARHTATHAAFLVRVLAVPAAQAAETRSTYQTALERQAGHVAAMRHPYILPLVHYGLDQDLPFLVWPQVAARSLTTRLAQSGPVDVVTVGRYLDQLASALEYAHERQTIHRNLSTDCIYLQMDGQLAVADFGVRRLFEVLSPDEEKDRFFGSLEACAPEQLQGGRVDTYTDVYALGAVTYRLLIGQPPFTAESFEALAREHLTEVPPPLSRQRPGIPAALAGVLAAALAKDPMQRFRHPGELADAYHAVIAPANATRVPVASHSAPLAAASPTQAAAAAPAAGSPGYQNGAGAPGETAAPAGLFERLGGVRLIVAGVLILALLSGGLFLATSGHLGAAGPATGTATFFDAPNGPVGMTNAVRLSVVGLSTPPSGMRYKAWLVQQQSEQILALGTLAAGGSQSYRLTYSSVGPGNPTGTNLLALGNEIEITAEKGDVQAPAGQVALRGTFAPQSFIHIKHILTAFPTTPHKVGLLVGLLQQSAVLNAQAVALQVAAQAGNRGAVQCRAHNIVNILEGQQGHRYEPPSAACNLLGIAPAGDGFGLLNSPASSQSSARPTGYLVTAADHASLAATTPDATAVTRAHAQQVEAAIAGMTAYDNTAHAAALALVTSPGNGAAVNQLVSACAQAYDGGSANATPADPSAPDAVTAYVQGQLMATLTLTAG